MNPALDLSDAEIGELDDLLAAVPLPLEALDVVMLDGYLCGILVQPQTIDLPTWLPPACDWNLVDGQDGGHVLTADTPGWHAAKHERLMALAQRRLDALNRSMVEQGWFDPIVMEGVDEQGQPLQGKEAIVATLAPWAVGFEHALAQFPALEELPEPGLPDLLACVRRHLPDQDDDEQAFTKALDAEHPLKSLDAALEDLVINIVDLADIGRRERLKVQTVRREHPKVGRNDPCPCGSGRKFKQCHGRES